MYFFMKPIFKFIDYILIILGGSPQNKVVNNKYYKINIFKMSSILFSKIYSPILTFFKK